MLVVDDYREYQANEQEVESKKKWGKGKEGLPKVSNQPMVGILPMVAAVATHAAAGFDGVVIVVIVAKVVACD